jgi:hypothetical protein
MAGCSSAAWKVHVAAVGGGALREQGHLAPAAQQAGDLGVHDARMAAAAAAQEDRLVLGGQPADQRPVAHLGLRDEGGRIGGVDHEDVQPRHVVGDQQAAGGDEGLVLLEADAEDLQQLGRPALPEADLPCRRRKGKPKAAIAVPRSRCAARRA